MLIGWITITLCLFSRMFAFASDSLDVSSRFVDVKGFMSNSFRIKRSVQGFSHSPLHYVVALEPLLVRLSDILRGSVFGTSVSAYADSITIYVKEADSLYKVGIFIEKYETVAGAKVNRKKSVEYRSVPGTLSRCVQTVSLRVERRVCLSC